MRTLLLLLTTLLAISLFAQKDFYQHYPFTEADTLRGALRPERTCYDVHYYGLNIAVDPEEQSLDGFVDVGFTAVNEFSRLQLDLYENMTIDRIVSGGKELAYQRRHNAVFVTMDRFISMGETGELRVYYHGHPTVARNAPWDGGLVWSRDKRNRTWIGVACEGDGASLWWPNKDHLSDEPDSMLISLTVPSDLMAVANGNLREVEEDKDEGTTRYDWFVSYSIDNYNVTLNIGHYTHFHDTYTALDGDTLALDYYVIDYNEERAREHFKQVHSVLACYETYMDKFPFWEDGFALVETPYLGMEHQSAIAYGNKYMRGYLGGLIPRDMDWDYIIVHETGHEYYGNSIGCFDLSEMWIQESFTTYLEAVYVEYTDGYADAVRYLSTQRPFIYNQEPIIGPADVNWEDWEGSDHYYKGAWILHTLRHAIHDDEKWWAIFKGFYRENAMSLITTQTFVDYLNKHTDRQWDAVLDQYLRYPEIPTLEYQLQEKGKNLVVRYRWQADVAEFDLPVLLGNRNNTMDKFILVEPSTDEWQQVTLFGAQASDFKVATELFLVKAEAIKK